MTLTNYQKYIVALVMALVSASILGKFAGEVAGGSVAALVPFCTAFVAFGVAAPLAYYFYAKRHNQDSLEQKTIDQARAELLAKGGQNDEKN